GRARSTITSDRDQIDVRCEAELAAAEAPHADERDRRRGRVVFPLIFAAQRAQKPIEECGVGGVEAECDVPVIEYPDHSSHREPQDLAAVYAAQERCGSSCRGLSRHE